jgi:hypothetical protein
MPGATGPGKSSRSRPPPHERDEIAEPFTELKDRSRIIPVVIKHGSEMSPRLSAAVAACIFMMSTGAAVAGPQRMLDPLTLPPQERQEALTAPLGRHGPFGEPSDPGCRWSRYSTPTPQGVRWLLEEDCEDSGIQSPY